MPRIPITNPPFSELVTARGGVTTSATAAGSAAAAAGSTTAAGSATSAGSAASAGLLRTAASSGVLASAVSIDVGNRLTVGTILRDGKEVVPPPLDVRKVADFLAHTGAISRIRLPVTVSQSIPPGTRVAKGTPVDLVLAPVSDLTFNLFDKVHADFAARSIGDVLPILDDPTVAPLLDRAPDTLTAQEKTTIKTALGTKGINIVDTDPARSFDLAFGSLQNARAFK